MIGVGSPPPPPKPSAEELALRRTQNTLLRQQIRQNERQQDFFKEITPELLESFRLQSDYSKQALEIQQRLLPSDEVIDKQQEVTLLQADRAIQALKGELPVDKSLIEGYEDAREKLDLRFNDLIGPGFESSSAYLDAVNDLTHKQELAYDASRRGDLITASQLFQGSLNRALSGGQASAYNVDPLNAILGMNQINQQGFGTTFNAASQLSGQYSADRRLAYEGTLMGYQGKVSTLNALIGAVGTLGGAWLGKG